MTPLRRFLSLLALVAAAARADWSTTPLGAFAVATLADEAVVGRLRARFHASGVPVFLLGNPVSGVQQGDILRFSDKAFLVDADVWQTLSAEGALRALRQSPVVKVQAAASPKAWNSRARIVSGSREKKLYEFGAALLKTLEQSMGGIPQGQRLFLSIEGGQLVLTAPATFLDRLRIAPTGAPEPRERIPHGHPKWVSPPPGDSLWLGQKMTWTAWAVDDSGGPTADLSFEFEGVLPAGFSWDAGDRTLQGVPLDTGHAVVRWKVSNDRGSDTFTWHPTVRRPHPPRLEGEPTQARCGGTWAFSPVPWSDRWPGATLKVSPISLPPGSRWDSASGRLDWTPTDTSNSPGPNSVCGKTFEMSFRVADPSGATASRTWSVHTEHRSARIFTEGLRVEMPWDTLLERRWYTWDPGQVRLDWDDAGIVLDSVQGNGDISWNGRVLSFRPWRSGKMDFDFVFRERGTRRVVKASKPVKSYLAPVFLSRLGGSTTVEGDVRSYRPVAVDPQGGPVQLLAEVPPGSPLSWDGRELVASPEGPGVWAARVEARDTLDQVREQWVEFRSRAKSAPALTVRHRWEAGSAPWEVEVDLGSGKIGLFTPDLVRMVAWKTWTRQDWPFLYGGVELLGAESRRRGNTLGLDLGISLRIPDPKILTGGVMARISGTANVRPDLPWTFEGEVLGWLRQGILLTDTVGYNGLVQSQSGGSGDPQADARYGRVFDRIEADDLDRHNLVILTRLEGWLHLPWDMGAGIGVWREDLPVDSRYDQRLGVGVRWRPSTPAGTFSAALRAGMGPGSSGAALWGDLVWTTGILP